MARTTIGMTLDCNDIVTVANFWRQALEYTEHESPSPGATFHALFSPEGRGGLHHLTLQQVPEAKAAKNRAHLDLFVDNAETEASRLTALGATLLTEVPAEPGGFRTLIMADPEGHEFCVVQRP